MARYVISDIHGHYDMLIEMLDFINFSKSDYLYILGDNIDRGEQNIEVLEFIRDNKNVESLIGNHELMMVEDIFISDTRIGLDRDGAWDNNGGRVVLEQLRQCEEEKSGYTQEMVDFINGWDYHKIIEMDGYKIVLIHSGFWDRTLDWDIEEMLKITPNFEKVWMRDDFLTNYGPKGIVTIFGHTQASYMHGSVLEKVYVNDRGNKIGIDCGVYRDNLLGCINIDTQEEFFVKNEGSGKISRKKGDQRILWDSAKIRSEESVGELDVRYMRTYRKKQFWATKGYNPSTRYEFAYDIDEALKQLNKRCGGNFERETIGKGKFRFCDKLRDDYFEFEIMS